MIFLGRLELHLEDSFVFEAMDCMPSTPPPRCGRVLCCECSQAKYTTRVKQVY